MALLADGLHMASHAAALGISVLAYVYARNHANDPRFAFGTGKVNSLAGFTSAVLLAVFALMMVWGSLGRFLNPVPIAFNQAIGVAILGLLVNGASVLILKDRHSHPPREEDGEHGESQSHDHNLFAAYLHVSADAMTSLLAIFALLTAKYFGLLWMDPLMGAVGAVLVSRWSLALLRTTSSTLLDRQGPQSFERAIKECLERNERVLEGKQAWAG